MHSEGLKTEAVTAEQRELTIDGTPKLSPEKQSQQWAKIANSIGRRAYESTRKGAREWIEFGAFLNYICAEGKRSGIIPHSQFGPWLQKNLQGMSVRASYRCRETAREVVRRLDLPRWQNCHSGNFEKQGPSESMTCVGKVSCLDDFAPEIHLLLYRIAAGKGPLPREQKGLSDRLDEMIEGRSTHQLFLEFKTVEETPTGETQVVHGGDRVWDAFIREKHPELIVDGRVPKRGKVDQSVRDELAAIAAKRMAPTAEELAQDTRTTLEAWLQVTRSILANENLPVLMPQEFTAPLSVLSLLKKRFETLHGRFRRPSARKRKKSAPAPRHMPKETVRAIEEHLKSRGKNGAANGQRSNAPALAGGVA